MIQAKRYSRCVPANDVRAESGPGGKPGRVLFAEKDAHLTITLRRTPTMLCLAGHCLHK